MIMELVRNRSFTLTTGDSKQSRLRYLKNGVPQASILAPLLFKVYTCDLPFMISVKFAYADDLALLHSSEIWKLHFQRISRLLVTAAFHLNNREAKRELKVYDNGRLYRSVQSLIILV